MTRINARSAALLAAASRGQPARQQRLAHHPHCAHARKAFAPRQRDAAHGFGQFGGFVFDQESG